MEGGKKVRERRELRRERVEKDGIRRGGINWRRGGKIMKNLSIFIFFRGLFV